ncbi:MAG: cupin domain-containing protein [Vampirovibrionia bacterium]
MAKISIIKPDKEYLDKLGIDSWGTWGCDISKFDWEYSDEEMCYIFEGQVTVTTDEETVEINPGDFVTFPKGLKCTWNVSKPIRKVYKFNY